MAANAFFLAYVLLWTFSRLPAAADEGEARPLYESVSLSSISGCSLCSRLEAPLSLGFACVEKILFRLVDVHGRTQRLSLSANELHSYVKRLLLRSYDQTIKNATLSIDPKVNKAVSIFSEPCPTKLTCLLVSEPNR